MYSLLFDCFKKRDLHFVHLNIRSILPKIDQLREFVRCNKPAILGLTETWCDNSISESEISLPNYICYRNDRNRVGSGVCVFVRCDIAFNTRPDLGNDYIESVWIEILLPKSKPILVGVCYWPHKQMDFTKSLKIFVQRFFELEVMILGDFNTNFLKHQILKSSTPCVSMNGFMNMFNLQHLITTATTVTATCKSIINSYLCQTLIRSLKMGVIKLGLSDHFGTYCTRKIFKSQTSGDKVSVIRNMKNYSTVELCTMLSRLDWSSVFSCNDVNQAFQNLKTYF